MLVHRYCLEVKELGAFQLTFLTRNPCFTISGDDIFPRETGDPDSHPLRTPFPISHISVYYELLPILLAVLKYASSAVVRAVHSIIRAFECMFYVKRSAGVKGDSA